jgi:DNA-directed RNA polymerase subunit RPC12/RpoP/prefoldin subunit 5
MDEFIALRCPSCGGNIQVEKNLEKIFCTHCGTQLLLKHGADGLLTPMMARDLTASAQLKETQNAMMVIDLLKKQIGELEGQVTQLRKALFEYYNLMMKTKLINPVKKMIVQYSKVIGIPQPFDDAGPLGKNLVRDCIPDALLARNTPGFNTAEDMARFFNFIVQPQNYDKEAQKLATLLQSITKIWPELNKAKQDLKKAMDGMLNSNS